MDFKKLQDVFNGAVMNKTTTATTLMNFLSLPSDVKSWILQKFIDEEGNLQAYELSEYIKEMRLKADEWNIRLLEARHMAKGQIRLLTKVYVEFDYAKDLICFSLPEYGFPKKKQEAQLDWSVISSHKKSLLNPNGAWGEITLCYDCGIVQLVDFQPLCPYSFDLKKYQKGREAFTTEKWIDILISGLNFNPDGFDRDAKLTLLQRFLPFVEKRLNQIELAIKGSGKSYCYSQLSVYNWLTAGTVSRATAFYNNTTKKTGYFSAYDNVIFDEVQTLKCMNTEEMNASLKTYLESGEIRIGAYSGTADAGLTLVGNIPCNSMSPEDSNLFTTLPKMFKESALIDRFALIIEGEKIGRFTEDRKFEGWGLSSNYLTGMFHELRNEFYYRAIVDELIQVEGSKDTRNIEAVKKTATAYLKLLFPHIRKASDIDKNDFEEYCLKPAIRGRYLVLCQLRKLDSEYDNVKMPIFSVKSI